MRQPRHQTSRPRILPYIHIHVYGLCWRRVAWRRRVAGAGINGQLRVFPETRIAGGELAKHEDRPARRFDAPGVKAVGAEARVWAGWRWIVPPVGVRPVRLIVLAHRQSRLRA